MLQEHYNLLQKATFSADPAEGAAYLLCGVSRTDSEVRLLVRDVVPVKDEHYAVREPNRLSIMSSSYASVAKRARIERACLIFVHSHPGGFPIFSDQDNREEPKLMEFFESRIPDGIHGSLLLIGESGIRCRVRVGGAWRDLQRVRIIGTQFRFVDQEEDTPALPEFFDRQVRAFGPDIQMLLSRLHVGVVGAGGTGSAIIEQLVRLGVGTITVFDGDAFEATNVTRVYGSSTKDVSVVKATIAERNGRRIEVGTTVTGVPKHISDEQTARRLRECDVIFGCTDRHAPRGTLVQIALRYLIPVFDMAVKIDAPYQIIRGIIGRVTLLLPGEACLFCRERISARMIAVEALSPEEREALADEGYAPHLGEADPAVITFTTAVAAQAVSELLHRLTGFMGSERVSSEILMLFHETTIRRNRPSPKPDCICSHARLWGKGDERNFLGLMWPDDSE